MDKTDRIIAAIRQLREEMGGGMTTGSSGGTAGLSADANPAGPVAGNTYPLPIPDGRSRVMRRLPPPYKAALLNKSQKRNKP